MAAGTHHSADSRAECSFEVRFQLRGRVRFDADFFAESSLGYNTASVVLAVDQGPTLHAVAGDDGSIDSLVATGWLPAGDDMLRPSGGAIACGTHNQADSRVGRCTAELRVFHELDYHMDGRVTRIDRRDVRRACLVGHPPADSAAYTVASLAY